MVPQLKAGVFPIIVAKIWPMNRPAAIKEIRDRTNQLSAQITALHPLVPKLDDAPTQGELLKALFELTKQVEVVKKHLLKLEKRDDSTAL